MKKSVIILIAVIYIASIGIVSFFGLNPKTYGEEILIETIEISDPDIYINSDGIKAVDITPDENGELKYKLNFTVTPEDATDLSVIYIYEKDDPCATVDEETGTVSFDPANMLPGGYSFTIEVQAAKGDSKDKIQINAEP